MFLDLDFRGERFFSAQAGNLAVPEGVLEGMRRKRRGTRSRHLYRTFSVINNIEITQCMCCNFNPTTCSRSSRSERHYGR